MARPLRIEYPGAIYHIPSRGTKRSKRWWRDTVRPRGKLPIISACILAYRQGLKGKVNYIYENAAECPVPP
jgi:hypothetical protein